MKKTTISYPRTVHVKIPLRVRDPSENLNEGENCQLIRIVKIPRPKTWH